MSNKYVVDTGVISEEINNLKKLKLECQEGINTKLPTSKQDKGKTHNEINNMFKEFETTFKNIEVLIDKTISFLGGESSSIEQSDINSAKKLKG